VPTLLLPLCLACVAGPQALDQQATELEFASVLAHLGAPELAAREEAGRRLAASAHEGRVGALAAFLRGADEESRARVAAALASRGSLLPVVAALATDPDARVARPGAEALQLATLAEAGAQARPSLSDELEWLARAGSGTVRVEGALLAAPAEELLAILLAAAGHPFEFVVDPDRAPEHQVALPAGAGDLPRWLSALAQVRGAGHRLRRTADGRALIVVGGAPPAPDEPDHAPAAQHADFLARSVRASLAPEPARRRAGCAALARSGWSAAQAWIERRASEGEEAAVVAVARAASLRGASAALRAPAARAALDKLRRGAAAQGDLALGTALAAALGASAAEWEWPAPADSRTERLLQLVEALHAPIAPRGEARLGGDRPTLLGALASPEADLVEVLWCWRVAARHGCAVPTEAPALHGERLARALAAAGEAPRLLELARATGAVLPPGGASAGVPSEVLLAAWCESGDARAARGMLEELCARSPLAAAKAWRAARSTLGPRAVSVAAAALGTAEWIVDEAARDDFLLLVGLRAVAEERLMELDAPRLDHLAGDPSGVAARTAWLERCDPARKARRAQLERADAIGADLRDAGAVGPAWTFLESVRAKLGEDERRVAGSASRLPAAPRSAVGAAWFDPVPGRSLGSSP
jgi:hypothetical protein